MFENKVLRKIFVAKRDEITEEWEKGHNVGLNALYCLRNVINKLKSERQGSAGPVVLMEESRETFRILKI